MRDKDVEYARALIAHAARPDLTLMIYPYLQNDDNIDAWPVLDTILFALRVCHKSRAHVEEEEEEEVKFPLMSLFG